MNSRMCNTSLLVALATSKEMQYYDEVRYEPSGIETPKAVIKSPDGRTQRQAEKRAQKQAAKDRRRAFRHSVEKQNKIAKAVDVRNKPQQAKLSTIEL